MNTQRIAEIREWMEAERGLYARFCEEKDMEYLHLTRARVFFQAMRDLPELLSAAEDTIIMRCGHPQANLRWTKAGKEICLACEWDKKRKAKKT